MASKTRSRANRETWEIDGREVEVTSLDRVLWPDDDLTKGDMLEYYATMADTMLRYVRGFPVTLHVFPRGINEAGYYRRRMPDNAPNWIQSVDYEAGSRTDTGHVPVVQSAADLVWFANQGSIEFHMWTSLHDDVDHPRWAVFDLDPGEKVGIGAVCSAAMEVRKFIESDGLEGFCKTSGSRGMHIFVPLDPRDQMEDVREWVKHVADRAKDNNKRLIESGGAETHSGSKVTVDDAQNSVARNTAAPYTLRALPKAPVSAPVSWEEVENGKLKPADFTLKSMAKRLDQIDDLWEPAVKLKQSLPVI